MRVRDRLRHAWDAFRSRDPTGSNTYELGPSNWTNGTHTYLRGGSERTIIAAIKNRIAIDVAAVSIRHVRLDENGRYTDDIDDSLNQCLTISPNVDQTPRAFIQDVVLSMFEEGYVAIFPGEADLDPIKTGSYSILSLRKGKILQWYPEHVQIEAYNPATGLFEQIVLPKQIVAIVENPFWTIMNSPNSTLQRLVRKLAILDAIDEQSASGKMDLIIQLPYSIRSDFHREEAEKRRKDIEIQLTGSKYGIAYVGATERITQLNRPLENNLLTQVEYLTNELYAQLGLTPAVFNGTASEEENLNYNNRTIEPTVAAISDEMKRKFLTKTARSQGQSIMYFRDPFKLAPVSQIAEIADKFTRNEILSSNEIRAIIGFRPSKDPKADELRNSNIAASKQENEEKIAPDFNTDDELPQE